LEVIKEEKPELILLDLDLPRKDGISIIKDIKEIHNYNPRIIVVSGENGRLKELVKLENITYFMSKPVDVEQLIQVINNLEKLDVEVDVINLIEEEIKNYNFNTSTLAYKYLVKAIKYAMENEDLLVRMEKNLLRRVSNDYKNVKPINVKWAIEKLIIGTSMSKRDYVSPKYFIEDISSRIKKKKERNHV
jgi:CheY-like chemotaxis protein